MTYSILNVLNINALYYISFDILFTNETIRNNTICVENGDNLEGNIQIYFKSHLKHDYVFNLCNNGKLNNGFFEFEIS